MVLVCHVVSEDYMIKVSCKKGHYGKVIVLLNLVAVSIMVVEI